jgi:endoglucanase
MIAQHYSSWDADRIFFEILNEPEMHDPYRWYGVEAKLAAAIRQNAPAQTIIAPGARWDDDDDLLFSEPLRDSNIIYVFHFYSPHVFTHQGASWSTYYLHSLHGLHYPSSPENAAQVATLAAEARDRLYVVRYGQDHWDATRIEADINQVAEWAKKNGVPVICNEFGVYRYGADSDGYVHGAEPQDRAAWLKDVRTTLERHNIGWDMWDYSGGFGIVTKQEGKATLDENIAHALGLK